MSLSLLFRSARQRSKLSQLNASKQLGIDQTYLSKIENAHMKPGKQLCLKAIELYQMTQSDADGVCILAGFMPPDIEGAILTNPYLWDYIREYGKQAERIAL